ncbi:hypothetical protein SERLA73DRAFT_79438 [Serpula lacrymans var. lacrymans S7.3]|uniref:RING-type domain-containing protein n=1 Tax=Serpula lacrymans var. lacrymans (strain S7.3) TaxID=936435 RepID=F8QGE5_SERL3|nr:hypothetical protein SERLA73DRAFT_79438 [Serpula lacrymans var. lacrymans S7.3]
MDSIRTLNTQHVDSARLRARYYWPQIHQQHNNFRGVVNLSKVTALLNELWVSSSTGTVGSVAETPDENRTGKKRSASSSEIKPSKRPKLHVDSSNPSEPRPSASNNNVKQIYAPNEPGNSKDLSPESSGGQYVPVFRHVLDLQYTKSANEQEHNVDNVVANRNGWLREEDELNDVVRKLQGYKSTSRTFELGTLWFRSYGDRVIALLGKPRNSWLNNSFFLQNDEWHLLVPRVIWPDGLNGQLLEHFDIGSSPNQEDMLLALYNLQLTGHAKLHAKLRVITLPSDAYDADHDLPFRFQLEYTVSLVLSTLCRSFPWQPKRQLTDLEDIQRRFLFYIFRKAPISSSSHDSGDINIPFLYSILRPALGVPSQGAQEALQPKALLPTLLPFQRRSVAWMLEREGKVMSDRGELVSIASMRGDRPLALFWEKIDLPSHKLYINRISGAVSLYAPQEHSALGGILAEEPGLGKTLECISLIMLNPGRDRNPINETWDPEAQLHVKEIKTTLIVTPPSLAPQWADELANHAPTLKVFVYDGWAKVGVPITEADAKAERERLRYRGKPKKVSNTKSRKRKRKSSAFDSDTEMDDEEQTSTSRLEDTGGGDKVLDWCSYINSYDVCITTYNVLRQDFTVARAAPKRPRRQAVVYSNVERPRSPLVMCEWYRVIMDEVQMMGSGKSEEMVSLIPRLSSFAVSGTPARSQVADLIHVLRFLRVDNLIGSMKMWNRLLLPGLKAQFTELFQRYAIRTMKSAVSAELTIPQQTRYLVSIELGRVERHVYDQKLEAALLELGLDARGVAASDGWQVDASLLRSLLRQLRGICTHPQVGQLQKQGDKLFKPGALKSMGDVLEAMRDQNWRNLMDDRKTKTQSLIRYAQLQQHDEENRDRYQRSLESLLLAEKELEQHIEEIKNAITEHGDKGEALKKEATLLGEPRTQKSSTNNGAGKGKMREMSPLTEDESDDGDSDLPHTPAGEEHRIKKRALQQRLRECHMVLHQIKFLQGDIYHSLGQSYSESEDAAYEAAEKIRKDLLKATEESATRAMAYLKLHATGSGVNEKALMIQTPYIDNGGIRTAHLFEEANEIIEYILNEQTTLLWQWRTRIHTLLTEKLSAGNDEADGQEYSRTLETQGDAEICLQAYATLLADRREVLVAERTLLASHDAKEKKSRNTNASKAAAEATPELEIPEDVDLQPQHEVLHQELSEKRKDLLEQSRGRAIKSIMVDLTTVAARIINDKDPEKTIARDAISRLRSLIATQGSLMDKLDADLVKLRKAFNERILYFRQLQEISDTVAEVSWETGLTHAMEICLAEHLNLDTKIKTGRARQRYLNHLAKNKEEGKVDEDDETCILCRCEFTRGFITQCAHVFCEGCMKAWLTRKEGRVCPVCRVLINVDQLQRFAVKGDKPPPPQPVLVNNEPAPKSRREIEYNMIDPKLIQEIGSMESTGSYGSKIQTLIRHLLYLQVTDPGSKSIVFSAWADSLHIIQHALNANGIQCLRIDQAKQKGKESAVKRFRTNPEILVLLLHGERENAGLNVTCASRVFLVESVVHHGFEMQAIARIDRMGQNRRTEVFCYYAEDTVERNILDLAARQGLSLYTKDNYAGTLNVTPYAMDSEKRVVDAPAKKQVQKGDFIFKVDDMLAILFPHMFEDLEYLIPLESDESQVPGHSTNLGGATMTHNHINAAAGPSRVTE